MTIKFNRYHVTNGTTKARVHYALDNRTDGRKCVTIYAKDYTGEMGKIFADYINNTDSMADYFEKGKTVLFETNPLYAQARARVEGGQAAIAAQINTWLLAIDATEAH